ncbi:MAG: hypothetical protein K6T88_21050 [Bacillus sp. (in: Bacteria)]|nr:hypothetical protein [Bacillus sp. (in: firmicutes)]
MEFIKPKKHKTKKSEWLLSERALNIVKYYAEYTGYTEDEVLEKFLTNILLDKEFEKWINNKRNNKRILKDLELDLVDGL